MAFFQPLPAVRPPPPAELLGKGDIPADGSGSASSSSATGGSGSGLPSGSALQVVVDWTAHKQSTVEDSLAHNPVLAFIIAEFVAGIFLYMLYSLWIGRLWCPGRNK